MRKWDKIVSATLDKYVLAERVEAGHVLHIHNCYAHAPENAKGDKIELGIQVGGEKIIVRARGTSAAKDGMSALRDFFIGEDNQLYAYFPDADNGDIIGLHVIGHMMSAKEWHESRGL